MGCLTDGDGEIRDLGGIVPFVKEKLIKVTPHLGNGFIKNHFTNLKIQGVYGLPYLLGI
jgi:hypothetical protein